MSSSIKNIHVISTDKPSRVFITKDEGLGFDNQMLGNTELDCQNQNIYITSDEEIKEGDWFYDLDTKYVKIKQSWENSHLYFNGKKIILTTDQDLIKDGVQAIDDEFLEWFVKNPSCEKVEVVSAKTIPAFQLTGNGHCWWKIIIPKENHDLEEYIRLVEKYTSPKQEQDKKLYSEEEVLKAQQSILCNIKDALMNKNYIIEYLNNLKTNKI
jgi:DNA-dependent RNA polymerase auxiliary subunit epsilon